MTAYYNEHDAFPAAWIERLVEGGHVAPGRVDCRDIREVQPDDVGDGQVHLFAGIGVWSYALRLAGVPDDAPVWTASCPCQPFSSAGKGKGLDDERHLWPEAFRLIKERRPAVIFGEQVARKAGRAWWDVVANDLEGAGYAVGSAVLCAHSVGAPHQRHRLFWMAYSDEGGWRAYVRNLRSRQRDDARRSASVWVEVTDRQRREKLGLQLQQGRQDQALLETAGRGEAVGLGNTSSERSGRDSRAIPRAQKESPFKGIEAWRIPDESVTPGAVRGFWSGADWLVCRDTDKQGNALVRPTEPGTFPLVDGSPGRLGNGALRGYGNAIVPQVAELFVRSALEALEEQGGENA